MASASPPSKIACPHCQGLIKSPALPPGSPVTCPKCGQAFRLGEGSGFGVQGSESNVGPRPEVRDRKPAVEGPRSKVQGRDAGRPPPSPPIQSPAEPANPKSQIPNPKSRPPDTLVDPNLLPPPPPREKPKPTEVAVVCQLCGTRVYAPLDKIGKEVKCPDCHSRNVVPPLPGTTAGPQKPAGPTLEGTEEYGMSEVVERPKYRPLVTPRGEYEVLSAMDPAAVEHRLTVPGEKPRRPRAAASAKEQAAGSDPAGDEQTDDGEIVLAPPVERAESARDPRTILPRPELEPENELYDGRYDDGVIGDNVDPRLPDAWKRAPLVYGILEFLFYPSTLPRWLILAALLTIVVCMGQFTITQALGARNEPTVVILLSNGVEVARSGSGNPAFAIVGILFFIPTCAIWIVLASAMLFAVVERTANGDLAIEEWPGWNFLEWIPTSAYWVAASVVACIPGGLIGLVTLAFASDWGLAAFAIGAPPVLSWLVLFPLVLFSMLAEGSFTAIYSSHTAASLRQAASAWVYFYMYSIFVCLLAVLAGSLFLLGNIVGTICGAIGLTLLAFIDARLIGRVMWVAAQQDANSTSAAVRASR